MNEIFRMTHNSIKQLFETFPAICKASHLNTSCQSSHQNSIINLYWPLNLLKTSSPATVGIVCHRQPDHKLIFPMRRVICVTVWQCDCAVIFPVKTGAAAPAVPTEKFHSGLLSAHIRLPTHHSSDKAASLIKIFQLNTSCSMLCFSHRNIISSIFRLTRSCCSHVMSLSQIEI